VNWVNGWLATSAAQYCAGILLLATLPTTMRDSMRAMVVKQGLEVTQSGAASVASF
jgi:hypothetical protein